MNNRTIELKRYSDLESLKRIILQKMNLLDHKKDSVAEFELRLKNFIIRNPNLRIVFLIDRDPLEKDLKFKIGLANKAYQSYPENFQFGNPHNRWLIDPIIKTEDEVKKENIEFERALKNELSTLKDFLDSLEKLGNGHISVKDK